MSDQSAPSPLPSLSTTATSTSTTPGQHRTPDEAEIAEQKICTPLHALYCFDVLASHFENRSPVDPPFHNPSGAYGLFVTWNTTARRYNKKPSLRGCIGNFSPAPISKGLKDYALVSALEDHRFPPIKSSELPHLQCAVSLLTPFTPVSDPLDWTPGQHGIHITFPDPSSPKRNLSATYLPEIATDQGWSRQETILSAIQKAGYNRPVKVGDEVWRSIKTRVYESSKAGCTWDEYVAWKGNDKSEGGDQE